MEIIPPANPQWTKEMEDAALYAFRNEHFTLGESVQKFEEDFARYTGTKHAISVSSGTQALQFALQASGVKSKDEVITCASSFIATANSIVHAQGTPVFCDIDDSYLLDETQIPKKINPKTKGILPIDLYGNPANWDEINECAKKHHLFVIEDAAQSHGAEYKGKKTGSLADAACFSFYSTKNMTVCGDGGMVTTDDDAIKEQILLLRNHGRAGQDSHVLIGYTSRLNTVNAAIGRVQLRHLDEWVQKRRTIAEHYKKHLSDVEEIILPPKDKPETKQAYHLFVIKTQQRDQLKDYLRKNNIISLIHYPTAIPYQPVYQELLHHKPGDFPKSEELARQALSLPMFPELTSDQIHIVCENIHAFFF